MSSHRVGARSALLALAVLVSSRAYGGTFVYVADGSTPNAVSAFAAATDGSLSPVPGSPFATGGDAAASDLLSEEHLALSESHLYVANSASGTISAFVIDPATGVLTALPGSPFTAAAGVQTLAATPGGRFLYAGAGNAISVFAIASDGTLTALPLGPFTISVSGPGQGTIVGGMKVTPDGRFLAVAFPDVHSIVATFRIAQDGSLTQVGSAASGGSADLDVDCASNRLFAPTVVGSSAVDVYAVGTDGALSLLSGSPFTFTGSSSTTAALSSDDRFLFVNSASSAIVVAAVGPGGELAQVAGSPFATPVPPAGLATNASGALLYAASSAGEVLGFAVGADGALTAVPGSPLPTGVSGGNPSSIAVYPSKSCAVPAATAFTFGPTTHAFFGWQLGVAGLRVLVTDQLTANACSDRLACVRYANATEVSFSIEELTWGAPARAVGPGTYQVGLDAAPHGVFVVTARAGSTDASCDATLSFVRGTITLTSTGDLVTGSYDLTSASGGHFMESFSAANCGPAAEHVGAGDLDACAAAPVCRP